MPRKQPREKTQLHYENDSDRYYIMNRSKKVYLFDKRFKNKDTPTKAYLKLLEQQLKSNKTAAYFLNNRALNTTQVISLLSRYDIDIPKYRRNVDKIRRTFQKHNNRIEFDIINNRDAFEDEKM